MMFERLFRPKTTRIELDLTDAQIVQLRTVIDGLPMNPYVGLVVAVAKKLPLISEDSDGRVMYRNGQFVPLESAGDSTTATDSRPAQTPLGAGRAFSLVAMTPKGQAGLANIERLLTRLPHTGDGS